MFCEKCGKQLKDTDKFCEGCGAPVPQQAENTTAPVAPAQPVAENNAPVAPAQPVVENNAPVAPVAPVAPAQPKVKKPLPKQAKLGIIIGAAVAAVVAIVICIFAFVLPMFNKVDISKYVQVTFDEEVTIYDGYAEAYVDIDTETLYDEVFSEGEIDSLEDLESMDYEDLIDAFSGSSVSYYDVLDYCYIDAEIKDADEKETEAKEDEDSEDDEDEDDSKSSSNKENYDYVQNVSKDDVIVVNITWSEKKSDIKKLDKYEAELGVKFDRSPKTIEFKVSDIIEEEKLVFEDTVSVDILGYIQDNNLTEVLNFKDGDLEFRIKPFEFEAEGYTFKYSGGVEYSSTVYVYEDDDRVDSVSFYMESGDESGYSYVDDLSSGDVVTVTFDEEKIVNEGTFLAKTSADFTVTPAKPITAAEAKTNIETIKTTTAAAIEEDSSYYSNVEVVEAYYVEPKDTDSSVSNYIVVYAKCKYEGYFSKYDTYYVAYAFQDASMKDGAFNYKYEDYSYGNKDLASLKKYESYVTNTTDNTVTPIM